VTAVRTAPPSTSVGTISALACSGALLVLINYTVPAVTVPAAASALGSGPTGPAWILNAVTLGLSAMLLIAGGLADDHGRRRAYVIGTWALAAGSLLAASSVTTWMFVAARLVQGAASAAMLASSLGILGHAVPSGPDRVRATARYGAMLGLGIAIGPVLSGALAAAWNWRAVYLLLAVVAVPLAVTATRLLPESRSEVRRARDLPGTITLGLGTAALLTAITEGRLGWGRPIVLGAFALAVILLTAFVLIEIRRRDPLIDLRLLRRPLFRVSTGGGFVTGLAVIGPMTYLPTVLQLSHGLTPLDTAWLFCVWSVTAFLTSLQSRRLRLSPRAVLALGLLLSAAGSLPLLGVAGHDPMWAAAVAGLLVAGVGSGLINASLTHLAIESVPRHNISMGSGAGNTFRYLGSALGVAGMAGVVGSLGLPDGTYVTVLACATLATVTAVTVLLTLRRPRLPAEDPAAGRG
jgi:MFS family permease